MGVLKFGFPEKLLFDKRQELKDFLDEIDLDLTIPTKFDYPTLKQVKESISNTNFICQTFGYFEEFGKKKWGCLLSNQSQSKSPIYIENVENNKDKVMDIYFQKGDDEIIIPFLQKLSEFCGSILFYCDSGTMSLIKKDKTLDEIKKELGYFL